jgi:hypothetical protein
MTIFRNHFRGSIFYKTILYENGTISENGTILTILQSILYENGAIYQNGTILTIFESILYENGIIPKNCAFYNSPKQFTCILLANDAQRP